MGKIFVRERTQFGRGSGRPRFALVAVSGVDLRIYHSHLRREELEKLAAEVEADIVFLPRGEQADTEDVKQGTGGGRRRRRGRAQEQD